MAWSGFGLDLAWADSHFSAVWPWPFHGVARKPWTSLCTSLLTLARHGYHAMGRSWSEVAGHESMGMDAWIDVAMHDCMHMHAWSEAQVQCGCMERNRWAWMHGHGWMERSCWPWMDEAVSLDTHEYLCLNIHPLMDRSCSGHRLVCKHSMCSWSGCRDTLYLFLVHEHGMITAWLKHGILADVMWQKWAIVARRLLKIRSYARAVQTWNSLAMHILYEAAIAAIQMRFHASTSLKFEVITRT